MSRRKFKIGLLTITLALALAICGCAGPKGEPSVSARVDKKSIYIGDRIRLAIEIRSPYPLETALPEFKDYKIGEFEIKDSGTARKDGVFGSRLVTRWYSVTSYTIGKIAIPEVEVRYRGRSDKNWYSKKTRPIDISVESVLKKERNPTDIREIKGPLAPAKPVFLIAAAVLLAAALSIFSIVRVVKKLRTPPVKLPHETALEELEAIAAYLARTGDVKGYYVQVSDCVRRYIERIFVIKAPEMTTEEFLESMKESQGLSSDEKGLLKQFLISCDLVKFAKYNPTAEEIESVLSTARNFVEGTRPDDVHI